MTAEILERKTLWRRRSGVDAIACRRSPRLTPVEVVELLVPLQSAFRALRECVATEEQWATLCGFVTLSITIDSDSAVRGMGAHFQAADLCLQGIRRRAMDSGAWRAPSPHLLEIDAIDTAVDLCAHQLLHIPRPDLTEALRRLPHFAPAAPAFGRPGPQQPELAGITTGALHD